MNSITTKKIKIKNPEFITWDFFMFNELING
jgi:hypothetical protein